MFNNSKSKIKTGTNVSKRIMYIATIKVEFDQAKIKFFVIFFILLFFGLTTAVSEKYLNQILQLSGISLKKHFKPDMYTFVTKYISNVNLFALMVIVLGMGTFSNELENNKSVYFTLSRPVSRSNYFLTRSLLLVIGSGLVAFLSSFMVYFYGYLYFYPISLEKISIEFFMVSLLYTSMYSIMIMLSTKFSQMTTGLIGFFIFLIETIIAVLSTSYNPLKWLSVLALSNQWTKIYQGTITSIDLTTVIIALLIWITIPLFIGLKKYNKRDL